ncbi:hypothetical protein JYK14_23940 [Siccirubricoccus sp. KC 17139]|uniref:Uncharacterized protein n=1 Tax=Siccirubricoccus soli TaxID=2899147 RepID=A0ABT1DDC8_9PROT|nr:hypothetical protein [Siccirubricoccus soli]MCO6419189.1 hypothetical protein [Siccirubricoccus soli]MCP2685324.1 hypothetical protein [Siccirubricoccus soli]
MIEFAIVVITISALTGEWVPASAQPYLRRVYDSAAACEEAARYLPAPLGTRLVCVPRDPLSLFDPTQNWPPIPERP